MIADKYQCPNCFAFVETAELGYADCPVCKMPICSCVNCYEEITGHSCAVCDQKNYSRTLYTVYKQFKKGTEKLRVYESIVPVLVETAYAEAVAEDPLKLFVYWIEPKLPETVKNPPENIPT